MFQGLAKLFGRSKPVSRPSGDAKLRAAYNAVRALRAKYDAAQTTDDNIRHWQNADNLSARAANDPAVRNKLRSRSRYEVANNCYARGLSLTLANDCIGTGPRLQLLGKDKPANQLIEREFARWARAVGLAEKLRRLRTARFQDGEGFLVFTLNPKVKHPVKLDVVNIEADRVADPYGLHVLESERHTDGITFDEFGNPISYTMLRSFPGEASTRGTVEADTLDAQFVIHWMRKDRPGQARAVPETTPALPLFSMLRDFKLATLDAAKAAAAVSFVLQMPAGANTGEAEDAEDFEVIEFVRNMGMTLPEGATMSQFESEHPNSTLEMFENVILREIGRCLNVPKAIITGDSSSYNFASGRMDGQIYWKATEVDRRDCEIVVVDPIFAMWQYVAARTPELDGLIPSDFEFDHQWFWDGREHVDPTKNATARAMNLASGVTHRGIEYAIEGRDVDYEDDRAAELCGLSVPDYRRRVADKIFGADVVKLAEMAQQADDEAETEDAEERDAQAA